jgi:type I restriction enzyme M protein
MVLRRRKIPERQGKVLIVDASEVYREERGQNFLDREHAEKILAWVQNFEDVEHRVRAVDVDEIREEDWTLNISRYVLPPIGENIPQLDEAIADFKSSLTRVRETEEHLRTIMTEGGWLDE